MAKYKISDFFRMPEKGSQTLIATSFGISKERMHELYTLIEAKLNDPDSLYNVEMPLTVIGDCMDIEVNNVNELLFLMMQIVSDAHERNVEHILI